MSRVQIPPPQPLLESSLLAGFLSQHRCYEAITYGKCIAATAVSSDFLFVSDLTTCDYSSVFWPISCQKTCQKTKRASIGAWTLLSVINWQFPAGSPPGTCMVWPSFRFSPNHLSFSCTQRCFSYANSIHFSKARFVLRKDGSNASTRSAYSGCLIKSPRRSRQLPVARRTKCSV
jgi:hypothetical protein